MIPKIKSKIWTNVPEGNGSELTANDCKPAKTFKSFKMNLWPHMLGTNALANLIVCFSLIYIPVVFYLIWLVISIACNIILCVFCQIEKIYVSEIRFLSVKVKEFQWVPSIFISY